MFGEEFAELERLRRERMFVARNGVEVGSSSCVGWVGLCGCMLGLMDVHKDFSNLGFNDMTSIILRH